MAAVKAALIAPFGEYKQTLSLFGDLVELDAVSILTRASTVVEYYVVGTALARPELPDFQVIESMANLQRDDSIGFLSDQRDLVARLATLRDDVDRHVSTHLAGHLKATAIALQAVPGLSIIGDMHDNYGLYAIEERDIVRQLLTPLHDVDPGMMATVCPLVTHMQTIMKAWTHHSYFSSRNGDTDLVATFSELSMHPEFPTAVHLLRAFVFALMAYRDLATTASFVVDLSATGVGIQTQLSDTMKQATHAISSLLGRIRQAKVQVDHLNHAQACGHAMPRVIASLSRASLRRMIACNLLHCR